MPSGIAILLLCMVLTAPGHAASFDCNKASTFAEEVVCSDSRLTVMDEELARLYKAAVASSPDEAAVNAAQKAWLAVRDRCKDSNCIMQAYSERIAALKGGANDGVTGTYTMKGGEVRVQQANGKIKFFVSATHQANVGELSGEAPLSGDQAKYDNADNDCALAFKFSGEKLVVSQDGSCGMGLNVSGSGTYNRVSTAAPSFDEE
ncbi:MAG: lysozyme inhibitor LprI family protein [Methyloceanibacter sp.]